MTFKQETSLDTLNIDQYIDFGYPSPSTSSASPAVRGKSIATPEFRVEQPSNTFALSQPASQPNFSGPSHQYGKYQQQTGIPVGSLAKTLAVNQPNSFAYGGGFQQNYSLSPSDGYYSGLNTADDVFDFNTIAGHNPSFSNSSDMDIDFDSPISDLFVPPISTDFVDPNVIGGQEEDVSPSTTPVQSQVGRLWPGMHQQQAAMAKAQAQQRQQQAKMTQATPTPPIQRQSASRASASSSTRPVSDPIVEERISRLLNQMRQSSVTSSHEDDSSTPTTGSQGHMARQRKDEEDMDEDERLLASEEGKKLSSKERRQLRNKVSARAFRSRRKEYIGQLEGELAVKGKEADDLRSENDALKSENTRLTDLTRMLLSSSAFSSFLNDLSNNGMPAISSLPAVVTTSTSASTRQEAPSSSRKDANPHQRQFQSQSQGAAQIGMALVPDNAMDFSVFDPTAQSWGGNMQVFSVTEVPQGPAIDTIDAGILSGKSSDCPSSYCTEAKEEIPVIERMPEAETIEVSQKTDFGKPELDTSNPAFALFNDEPLASASKDSNPVTIAEPEYRFFGGIQLEKAFARLELVVDEDVQEADGIVSSTVMARFERICAGMDAALSRIAAVTAHL